MAITYLTKMTQENHNKADVTGRRKRPSIFVRDIERLSRRMHELARRGDLLFAELYSGSGLRRDAPAPRPEGAKRVDRTRVASRAHKVQRSVGQRQKA